VFLNFVCEFLVDEQRAAIATASKLKSGSAEMREQFEEWLDGFDETDNLTPDQMNKEVEAYWARQRALQAGEEVS
jgi:hypothetical protein